MLTGHTHSAVFTIILLYYYYNRHYTCFLHLILFMYHMYLQLYTHPHYSCLVYFIYFFFVCLSVSDLSVYGVLLSRPIIALSAQLNKETKKKWDRVSWSNDNEKTQKKERTHTDTRIKCSHTAVYLLSTHVSNSLQHLKKTCRSEQMFRKCL